MSLVVSGGLAVQCSTIKINLHFEVKVDWLITTYDDFFFFSGTQLPAMIKIN